ncbi:Alpha/Beta hydrolase protein [Mycena alexandri]|uniref:Alpha/Beta hydrolase protein n=1 Tax=Mycena alexandri TaxID=1745969 RepID=A0AAD6T6J1_9AGAR|nr:Alpha/Beta hydrolase protein [Mycena alexandri]
MRLALPWPLSASAPPQRPPDPPPEPPRPALHHYANPGVAPPSARVDPNLKAPERSPVRLWHLWKYGLVVVSKATEMTGAVISHNIWGPRRKSWGIEMTLITSFMRGAGRHSALVDIATIRMAMSLSGLIPLPSDALVTPVTFRVRRRKLRGILADLDAAETGARELAGEWVVGRRTWQRLQAEWQQRRAAAAAAATNTNAAPPEPEKKRERVVLYIHGGAYYLSSAAGQRLISIPLSKYTDARVFALDYRLAPETRFPGPLHDAVSAYLRLVEDLHIPAENIIVCGDSAGGGLSLALLMYLRDNAYPLTFRRHLEYLTMSCESWDLNAPFDVVPIPTATNHMNPIALYLGDQVEQYLTHPYASPLFGDFKGLPPLLIQAGDAEVLRDEIALLAHKATLAGVEVRHELYEDAVHIFQTYPFLNSAHRAFMSMHEFVRAMAVPAHLGPLGAKREIDTEDATVVRGDGVESETFKEDLEEERTESEPEDLEEAVSPGLAQKTTYFPSWGPSRLSIASPPTTDDEDEEEEPSPATPPDEPAPTSALRRIRSAVSVMIPDSISRPALKRHRSQHYSHRRSNSSMSLHHLPTLSTFTMNTPPPSPSIRRRNSTATHPDITRLVENWTHSGPANETLIYKPMASHSRPP